MKWASETYAIRASAAMSSGSAYARSIASRARSSRRFASSVARLTEPSHHVGRSRSRVSTCPRPTTRPGATSQAALGARRELGFEYEEAIAAGLLDRVNQLALMRASEIRREAERIDHVAEAEKESRTQRFVLGIISLGVGIPITAISANVVDPGSGRRAGLLGRDRRGQRRCRDRGPAPNRPVALNVGRLRRRTRPA